MGHGASPPPRDGYAYPLFRRNDRSLPPAWAGPVYLWDIDNTYLITEYAGLRDLVRIRFEAAEDKRPVPGAVELLAGLRRGADPVDRPPIYFVSASPETMRPVLERRMLIDGVAFDGITFRNLRKLRYLRDIFGYKVAALLLYRLENPREAKEALFGDDREHDAEVYVLYARACAGQVRGQALAEALAAKGVGKQAIRYIVALAAEVPERDPVEWIFIRRTGRGPATPPEGEDPRVVRVDDFGQVAAVLHALGRLTDDDLARVVQAARAAGLGAAPEKALATLAARLDPGGSARTRETLARLLTAAAAAPGPALTGADVGAAADAAIVADAAPAPASLVAASSPPPELIVPGAPPPADDPPPLILPFVGAGRGPRVAPPEPDQPATPRSDSRPAPAPPWPGGP